ncbi:hypothetical protein TEA_010667 [Camellia sinensis var. sinensis]|uniref:Protein kinase domain-containing protein n=1 Tax=Camellia sinensis var. sinensis TaxID=542762 RepID=A0A4S4E491_CAMSN|nr:hypothetical protein TEA_010667 [Camellia sinensis var. sinensis]
MNLGREGLLSFKVQDGHDDLGVLDLQNHQRFSLQPTTAGLPVGSIVLVGGFALLGFVLWKKRKAQEEDEEFALDMSMDNEFEAGTGPKKFSYGELFCATNNFTEEQKLGEGGFDRVCRGFFRESNSYVAVKRISKGSKQGRKEYTSDVKILSKASKESDVYSFGVVLLEIACGRKLIDLKVPESQMRMVEWVWDLYGIGRLLEAAVDPKICPDFFQE